MNDSVGNRAAADYSLAPLREKESQQRAQAVEQLKGKVDLPLLQAIERGEIGINIVGHLQQVFDLKSEEPVQPKP